MSLYNPNNPKLNSILCGRCFSMILKNLICETPPIVRFLCVKRRNIFATKFQFLSLLLSNLVISLIYSGKKLRFIFQQQNQGCNTFPNPIYIKLIKVLEYLRTCNILYLINGPRVTFGIFDRHMLKKGILSYQTT